MKGQKTLLGWANEIVQALQAGVSHSFLLTGNVNDLVVDPVEDSPNQYWSLVEFLSTQLYKRIEAVVVYDIGSGFSFPSSDSERNFRRIVGLDQGKTSDPIEEARRRVQARYPEMPSDCLDLIERLFAKADPKSVIVIIRSVESLAPAQHEALFDRTNVVKMFNWIEDLDLKKKGNPLFLIANTAQAVDPQLSKNSPSLKKVVIERPNDRERRRFIRKILDPALAPAPAPAMQIAGVTMPTNQQQLVDLGLAKPRKPAASSVKRNGQTYKVPQDFDIDAFSIACQGLTLAQILDTVKLQSQNGVVRIEDVAVLKKKIISDDCGDLLEVVSTDIGFEQIGGLEHVKAYIAEIIDAMRSHNIPAIPMGVALIGPPGTGKTTLAKAMARATGLSCVKLKNIRDMWFGQSEANLQKVLQVIKSLAPVIVIRDEVDQEGGKRGGGYTHETDQRIQKAWFEFASDPEIRGDVLIVNCTNRPDLMDPASLRAGRADDRIPVLMPCAEERTGILQAVIKQNGFKAENVDYQEIAEKTVNYSGADLNKLALEANRLAQRGGRRVIYHADFQAAVADVRPSVDQKSLDEMTYYALKYASAKRFYPQNYREVLQGITDRGLAVLND